MGPFNQPPLPCIIHNEEMHYDKTYDVLSSLDHKTIIRKASCLQLSSIEDLLSSSHEGFKVWSKTPLSERRQIFSRAAKLLELRKNEFIEEQIEETTSSREFASFDISTLASSCLNEIAHVMSSALRGEIAPSDTKGKRMFVVRESMGVILSIGMFVCERQMCFLHLYQAPWNAPSILCMRSIMNPLAAGNAVILKTSEYSPKVHQNIASLFHDAGLPAGVLNVVHVDPRDAPQITKAIIEHPLIRKINFTGMLPA